MRYLVGKTRRGDKEYTKEQRLSRENKLLKRELAYLRKQISRIDLDRYESAKETFSDWDKEYQKENPQIDSDEALENLKKIWQCKTCTEGWLEITFYSKLGETFYFRKCNNCSNRTKGKRYTAEIKGIVKK